MKRKTKLFTSLILSSLSVLCLGAACATSSGEAPLGEEYNWIFNKPYAGEPDEGMKVDGYLNEDVWQDNKYLAQTIGTTSWSATTHFSEKGLYIAVEATDLTMSYKTRYTNRSNFAVYICKTGAETIDINGLAYHPGRCQQFLLDPYYCRSKDRVAYYYEAHVEGELNSETECTMTAELFLTWEDLYYTQDELGENGYPETIQMYVNYEGESNEVLGSCLWREETYFHYNKDGYMGEIDHADLGSVKGGLAATDQWTLNEDGKPQTTAGRTQILWLKDVYAKDFMFEAEIKPLGSYVDENGVKRTITLRGETVSGRVGLITGISPRAARYNLFSAAARSFSSNGTVSLQTCKQTDSFHWQNLVGLSSQTVTKSYPDDTLVLRIIKSGDMFYYFYGDSYWNCERIPDLQDQVYCGFYTSQGMVVEDYRFENYEGKADELQTELSKYMYFVNVSGEMTRGSVTTSSYAVAKGKDVTISFLPKSRSVLTEITMDGEDVYDKVVAAMNEECEYTFTPTSDVTIEGEFSAFPNTDVVKTVVVFENENGERVMDASYEIKGSNKLLFYKGTSNAAGYVILQIPKAGTYEVGGRTFTVDGNYDLSATFAQYHDYETSFVLNDETTSVDINGVAESVKDTKTFTLYADLSSNAWGSVKVNGKTVSGSGKLYFNEETGNYYVQNGSVRRYFKATVATDYAVDVTLNLTKVGDKNSDLAAFVVTDGNDVLAIKINLENRGKVILATGNETVNTVAGQEYAITGFNYAKCQEPYGVGNNGYGEISFRIVKSGSAMYLFNSKGVMKAYFNKEGVHLVNGAAIGWKGGVANVVDEINADVKALFSSGEENAVGMFTYNTKSITAELDMNFSTAAEDVFTDEIGYGALNVDLANGTQLNDEYPVKTHYSMGEEVTIGVDVENARDANAKLLVTDANGIRIIDGVYDWANDCVIFKFFYAGGATAAKMALLSDGDMEWSDEWGEFIPDRDNTTVD